MSASGIQTYESNSPEETFEIAKKIGEKISPGSVLALEGDLGAGKTLFTQGVAEGLGVTEPVVSPTFTILQVYDSGRCTLYHYDVYRIEDPYEMEEVGFDDFIFSDAVSIIEWPERISEIMPDHYTRVKITRIPGEDPDRRLIEITEVGRQ